MSKAVLLSIKPQWCELIANGKKTVEVRKTKPKLEPPFKVYIYCTNTRPYLVWGDVFRGSWETEFTHLSGYNRKEAEKIWDVFNGKVIGEFVCKHITEIKPFGFDDITKFEKQTCLNSADIVRYLKGFYGYGWHISNLEIYDTPLPLSHFIAEGNCNEENCHCCPYFERGDGWHFEDNCSMDCGRHPIFRAPQSWCYVEEE